MIKVPVWPFRAMPPNSQSVLAETAICAPPQTVDEELGERVIPAMAGKVSVIHKPSVDKMRKEVTHLVDILKVTSDVFISVPLGKENGF